MNPDEELRKHADAIRDDPEVAAWAAEMRRADAAGEVGLAASAARLAAAGVVTFVPHAARSRWFGGPPLADVTPREAALRRDLLAAVEWAEGLVQVGSICERCGLREWHTDARSEGTLHSSLCGPFPKDPPPSEPVYVVREAR